VDAVIQVEAANLRVMVTETAVLTYTGRRVSTAAFAWITVSLDSLRFIANSIKSNAPNNNINIGMIYSRPGRLFPAFSMIG